MSWTKRGKDYIGKKICGVIVYDDLEKIIEDCDMVVDYSNTELSIKVLSICVAHGKGLLCGTTGFNEKENMLFERSG